MTLSTTLHYRTRKESNNDQLLASALSNAVAPVTGKQVACLIETEDGVYVGHNEEKTGSFPFIHAEDNAVRAMLKSESKPIIKYVYMAGAGNITRAKQVVPCFSCHNFLQSFTTPNTTIRISPLENDKHKIIEFKFSELTNSYKKLPFSKIEGQEKKEITDQIEKHTFLRGKQACFIAELRLQGLNNGISFYLTGSAANRGGTSRPILNFDQTLYNDIDLIAIGDNSVLIESVFEALLKLHFRDIERLTRVIPSYWPWYKVDAKYYYECQDGNKKLIFDLTIAKIFGSAWSDLAYMNNNWFHQLS